jgi:hypothetical protein
MHAALFSHNHTSVRLSMTTLACSLLVGSLSIWVYHNWTYQYFTGALILLVLYNTLWGFIHHYVDRTFTSRLALEYLILGLLVASIILAGHNFGVRLV